MKSSMIGKFRQILIPPPKIPIQSPRQARIVLKQLPEPAWMETSSGKPLSKRKVTILEKCIALLNRYVLKPLSIFQGSISAMTKTGVAPGKFAHLEAKKMWSEFNDPDAAYVLLFRNTEGPGKGSEHAAVVLGSTKGQSVFAVSGYASWAYDSDHKAGIPFRTPHAVNSFVDDYREHGKPVIIKIPNLNVEGMKHKWNCIQRKNEFYRLIGMNCSTIGYRLIRHGLGLEGRKQSHHITPKGFWTPLDLLAYAKSVQQGKTHSSAT